KIEKLELFIEMHAENPRVSYLYSPYLIYEQKVNRASHDSNLTLLNSLHSSNIAVTMAQQSGIPVHTISRGKAEKSYVDINDKASFEFVEDFKEKSKNILTVSEFITRYNVPGAARAKYTVTNGCIDLNIPQNKALLKRHLKLFPQPSKLYSKQGFDGKTSFVPIPYLVKLGYGSEESLLNLIKSKQIQGVIKEDATEKSGYKAWVNIANSDTEFILQVERRDNPNCISPKSLAQRLKITKSEVDSAIVSGSLEIIPKYIFTSDFNTPLIDLTVDKNAQFVEAISLRKQAEKEALYQERLAQKAQKEEYKKANGSILDLKNYLRMKLVWHLCPHTRTMQGKTLVYEKPWVMSIINKINCEGYSALSTDEKKQYLAYCKASWLNSGTDEFKDAHKLAKHYTDLYFEKGIDAIKDENIKIFILETMN
ncbi:hypothetical protein IJ670_08225, partial [bacterium]|nr:hypothetical protein [bacterium]